MQGCTPSPSPASARGIERREKAGSTGMGSTASHTPHLTEAPLRRRLWGLLLAVAQAEQPHCAQEVDQEAPAATHSRSCRLSPRTSENPALGRRPCIHK